MFSIDSKVSPKETLCHPLTIVTSEKNQKNNKRVHISEFFRNVSLDVQHEWIKIDRSIKQINLHCCQINII